MRTTLLHGLLGTVLLLASCSSSEDEPLLTADYGNIELSITPSTAFTRAVTEGDYANTANYTVEIWQGETKKQSFKYSEKPATITLVNGSYEMKAYYGKEEAASRTTFLVTGSMPFTMQGKDLPVSVNCAPTCGKLVVKFDKTSMDKHFSNYYVVYETEALKAAKGNCIWNKDDTDPWYVKLNPAGEEVKATIHYVRKSDNKEQSQLVTFNRKPNQKWTLNIGPKNDSGDLGITITIDESTNDKDVTIDIPSEWL